MLFREWITIALVGGFFLAIVFIAKNSSVTPSKTSSHFAEREKVQIILEGAVKRPGKYECDPGTNLRELLKNVGLSPEADRKKIPPNQIFFNSQKIEIPSKKIQQIDAKKFSLEEK